MFLHVRCRLATSHNPMQYRQPDMWPNGGKLEPLKIHLINLVRRLVSFDGGCGSSSCPSGGAALPNAESTRIDLRPQADQCLTSSLHSTSALTEETAFGMHLSSSPFCPAPAPVAFSVLQ